MSDVHSTGALRNCRDDGRCQYAIDHGAEGLGHCSPKCVMPRDQVGALRQQPEAAVHDRELLELAALAAGYDDGEFKDMTGWGDVRYGYEQAIWSKKLFDEEGTGYWNPLVGDSQAFRLAVRLMTDVGIGSPLLGFSRSAIEAVCALSDGKMLCEPFDGDPYSATRRAIVRAAAAIGSELRKAASGSHQEARSNGKEERDGS